MGKAGAIAEFVGDLFVAHGICRTALGKLRARKPEHEVGIVLIEPAQNLSVHRNRLIVAAVPHELFRIALAARDVRGAKPKSARRLSVI